MTCQSPDVPSATNESERLAPVGGTSTCDASKIDERVVGGCETAIGDDPKQVTDAACDDWRHVGPRRVSVWDRTVRALREETMQ